MRSTSPRTESLALPRGHKLAPFCLQAVRFPSHRRIDERRLYFAARAGAELWSIDVVQTYAASHGVQEADGLALVNNARVTGNSTYWFPMPPPTARFEPAKMTTSVGSTHDNVRVLLDALVRHAFINRYRIVDGV